MFPSIVAPSLRNGIDFSRLIGRISWIVFEIVSNCLQNLTCRSIDRDTFFGLVENLTRYFSSVPYFEYIYFEIVSLHTEHITVIKRKLTFPFSKSKIWPSLFLEEDTFLIFVDGIYRPFFGAERRRVGQENGQTPPSRYFSWRILPIAAPLMFIVEQVNVSLGR